VAPPDPPQIQKLSVGALEYRAIPNPEVTQAQLPASTSPMGGTSVTINNGSPNSSPSVSLSSTPSTSVVSPTVQPSQPTLNSTTESIAPITLDWEVSNLEDILELRLVSLAPDGTENTIPATYLFDQGMPQELSPFCQSTYNRLTCKGVPTNATEVGEYMFYLTVVTANGNPEEPIVKSTPLIAIKPPAPAIVDFQVNGESVKTKPRHVYVINPARGAIDIVLSWTVQNAKTVELQPAPGVIESNRVVYTLSAAAGAETITLRVINELDEVVTQSVVIEKVEYVPGSQAPFTRTNPSPGGTQPQVDTLNNLPMLPPPPTVVPVPELAPIRTSPQPN
jgi:hypothetical protein